MSPFPSFAPLKPFLCRSTKMETRGNGNAIQSVAVYSSISIRLGEEGNLNANLLL